MPNSWCTALDQKSGRQYYYNTTTGETTWTKPIQLASGKELEQMLAKKADAKRFFNDMESNMRNKIEGRVVNDITNSSSSSSNYNNSNNNNNSSRNTSRVRDRIQSRDGKQMFSGDMGSLWDPDAKISSLDDLGSLSSNTDLKQDTSTKQDVYKGKSGNHVPPPPLAL